MDPEELTLRDKFALHAPEVTTSWIDMKMQQEKNLNPHNDSYKPIRHGPDELRVIWRFQWADMMIKYRNNGKF